MQHRFEYNFFQILQRFKREILLRPLNLGGTSGSDGGSGGPPGGFIGTLPQTRVSYDYTEAASSGLPASGVSLLDNLKHIRYRITTLENQDIPSPVIIEENDVIVASGVTVLNFEGAMNTVNNGGGKVTVTISGGASLPSLAANRWVITDNTGALATNAYMNVGEYEYNSIYPSIVIGADNGYSTVDSGYLLNLVSDENEMPLILNLQGYQYRPSLDFRYSNGTAASPSATLNGDEIGRLTFYARATSDYEVAGLQIDALQDHTASYHGTKMSLQVTPLNTFGSVNALVLYSDTAEFNGDVELPISNAYYLGDRATNNSWRIIPSGTSLSFQRRESGVWVTKGSFAA